MIKGLIAIFFVFLSVCTHTKTSSLSTLRVPHDVNNSSLKNNFPPILLGSSTALTGSSRHIGNKTSLGERIYLDKINAEGGINHRKIQLIIYDDKYNPIDAALNIRRLVTRDKVLAIVGNLGSPMAIVSVPIINELKILYYGTFSGSAILRKNPPDRYVFNFKASHRDEINAMIAGLTSIGIKSNEIAFFTQNDALGSSGFNLAIQALEKLGMHNTGKFLHARFRRNTLNVEEGFSEFLDLPEAPKAIIIMAPYPPAAKFIKLATQYFPNTLFLTVALVDSDSLSKELGTLANNRVIVTQVVPDFSGNLPAIIEYRNALKTYAPGMPPGYTSLEAYLSIKLFVLGLEKAAKLNQLSREGVVDALETLHDVDIGIGIPISFDKNHHNAMHTVWPTLLKNGKFVPFKWSELQSDLR